MRRDLADSLAKIRRIVVWSTSLLLIAISSVATADSALQQRTTPLRQSARLTRHDSEVSRLRSRCIRSSPATKSVVTRDAVGATAMWRVGSEPDQSPYVDAALAQESLPPIRTAARCAGVASAVT